VSGVAPTNAPRSVDQVLDARVGGSLGLPDNTLQLVLPAGVADTDFLLVSLTEVAPTSRSANLQVGSRRFVLTVVDSGGATVTNFGVPILVRAAGTAESASITALDPTTSQFKTLPADAQTGQVTASLDKLAASATTGLADNSLTIASTATSSSLDTAGSAIGTTAPAEVQPQPASSTGSSSSNSFDPAQILRGLGLMP
jgi:hypothetical protein